MPGVATVISRFSLGIVLTALPILLAHFYGKDSAKTVALAINLSSYSSWLALGGYATVMRDFRLAENAFEKYRLSQIYRRLAFLQSVGALLLTVVIAGVYVKLAQPVYLSNSIDLLLIGLMFGVVIQCSSFWLNISLGISYSENRFIGLGIGVSMVRILTLAVVLAGSYASINLEGIFTAASFLCGFGTLFLYRRYRAVSKGVDLAGKREKRSFAGLVLESSIYFKWSLLATAVFVFPVTAIASAEPTILLPATIAFFLVGASQNVIAALITPQTNSLQDGVGDISALKAFFVLTAKTSALVTIVALLLAWSLNPFLDTYMDKGSRQTFFPMVVVLVFMAGVRALTLAPTQAAIALKKEKFVMLSPLLEAGSSIVGVSLCWFLQRGDLIIWIFVLAVMVRVSVAGGLETGLIVSHWRSKERLQ